MYKLDEDKYVNYLTDFSKLIKRMRPNEIPYRLDKS